MKIMKKSLSNSKNNIAVLLTVLMGASIFFLATNIQKNQYEGIRADSQNQQNQTEIELSLSKVGSNLQLSWKQRGNSASYNIYRSTAPYFVPSDATLLTTTTDRTYLDTTAGITGNTNENYFYQVNSADGTLTSNQVGEFDYVFAPNQETFISFPFKNLPFKDARSFGRYTDRSTGTISGFDETAQAERVFSWDGNQPSGVNFPVKPGVGYRVTVAQPLTLTVTGEVEESAQTMYISSGINFIGTMSLVTQTLYNASFIESGAVGASSELYADRVWAPVGAAREFDYAWLIDNIDPEHNNKWWDGDPWGESTITLKPGVGYVYQRRAESGFAWLNPMPR